MNQPNQNAGSPGSPTAAVVVSWLLVGLPLLWGIWETVKKSQALFH